MSAYQTLPDPTAVVAKRYLAAFIDWGIGALVALVLFFALSKTVTHYSYSTFNSSGGYTTSRELTGLGAVVYYGWILGYNVGVFVLWRGLTGRTTGTIAMGLVTVNEQGRPLGPGYALLRSVAGVVDYIPCCLPIVGIVTVASTKGHRRVGDMAAKSFVVDKAYAGQPIVVAGVTGGAAPGGPYAQPYGAQPYGTPYGAPGAAPYPPQPSYPGQPPYPAQPPYPTQPTYGTPAPTGPGTSWPTPAPEAHTLGHARRRIGMGRARRHRRTAGRSRAGSGRGARGDPSPDR